MNNESGADWDLKERLRIAEETLDAIRNGELDALVVKGPKGDQIYSIVSPDHPYQVFFENMDEAAVLLSNDNIVLYGNPRFFDMIGAPFDAIIGSSFLQFITDEDRSYFIECVMKKRKKNSELSIFTNEQKKYIFLASVFKGIWGESEALCLLLTDITHIKKSQHLIEASEAIARILSEAPNPTKAAKSIIKELHCQLGWEVMVIWLWNEEKRCLQCFEIAHVDGIDIEAFIAKTKSMETNNSVLFSHPCLSNRPIWITDVTEEPGFVRRSEASQSGIKGALAFPFNKNLHFGGIVELFQRSPFEESVDNVMLDLISSIGLSLGVYIRRLFSDQKRFESSRALELSLNSIYSADKEGLILSWSCGAEKMYGWTASEILGSSIAELFPKDKKNESAETLNSVFAGKPIVCFESQRLQKGGNIIWVTSSYEKTYDFFGNVLGLFVVEQDITIQKKLEAGLSESKERFSSFIEITEDWIWELDKQLNFTFSNNMIQFLLGFEVDQIIGKNFFCIFQPEEKEKAEEKLTPLVMEKKGWNKMMFSLLHKNGTPRFVQSNAKALLGLNGELLCFRGVCKDITETKNIERIKNEFISIVSHELRTPLTSISGALNLIEKKETKPEEKQQLLLIAQKNSSRLTKLINDIMDIEKLQLGKIDFDFKNINLRDVIEESISSLNNVPNKSNVKIIKADPLPNVQVYGDYWRLVQVMNNLLSNAIKFSLSEGTVLVDLELESGQGRVSVTDYGQGIPKSFQPKIFQSFAQADSGIKRTSIGMGLGLYISKYIVESHGGTITYATEMGKGTTFTFEIPLLKGQ